MAKLRLRNNQPEKDNNDRVGFVAFKDILESVETCESRLTPWERDFIDGIGRKQTISRKEYNILNNIKNKI